MLWSQRKQPLHEIDWKYVVGNISWFFFSRSKWYFFKNQFENYRDAKIPIQGRSLFLYFYENIDKNEPRDDPWTLDLGKIVVPNVFVDRELIDL